MVPADGSNDDKIAPKGLQNYQVPPPHQYLEPAVQLPESNQVEFELSLSLPLSLCLSLSLSLSLSLPLSLFDTMVVDENNFIPDNQELHERIDRE